jgi:hypothetical protein
MITKTTLKHLEMKHLLFCIAAFLILTAAQSWETGITGKYSFGQDATIEIRSDHTYLETRGGDWRKGMWKVQKDTLLLQEGMTHSSVIGKVNPNFGRTFFLVKTNALKVGNDLFKKTH